MEAIEIVKNQVVEDQSIIDWHLINSDPTSVCPNRIQCLCCGVSLVEYFPIRR